MYPGFIATGTFRGREFKILTHAEKQDRREKGLCFRCDGKFGPGHVCANKQLQLLVLEEEDKGVEEEEEAAKTEAKLKNLQLSLYSITGITSKKSIKLWGELAGRKMVVLIDCRASHNFISSTVVEEEEFQVTKTAPYTVEVGDGRKIHCEGVCSKLILQIQGVEVQQDFYIFELGGVDVVLGMEWLAGLVKSEPTSRS